jgi:hypothetical protein
VVNIEELLTNFIVLEFNITSILMGSTITDVNDFGFAVLYLLMNTGTTTSNSHDKKFW